MVLKLLAALVLGIVVGVGAMFYIERSSFPTAVEICDPVTGSCLV